MNFSYKCCFQAFDKGFVEIFGPEGLVLRFGFLSKSFSFFQSGLLYHYSFVMFFSLLSCVSFLQFDFLGVLNSFFFFLVFSYSLFALGD
jgi:hypothetical protein